jgi:hypothetical protein
MIRILPCAVQPKSTSASTKSPAAGAEPEVSYLPSLLPLFSRIEMLNGDPGEIGLLPKTVQSD